MRTQRRALLLALCLVLLGWAGYRGMLHLQDASLRASCRPQTILNMCNAYAEFHEGQFPPLSPVPGMLFYDPAICEEVGCLGPDNLCESDLQGKDTAFREAMYRQPRNDWSYVYLGYVVESEAEFLAFAKTYRNRMALGLGFDAGSFPLTPAILAELRALDNFAPFSPYL